MKDAIEYDIKSKREKEQKEIQEIKEREKNLLEDVKLDQESKEDKYATLNVKKAQLTWTLVENNKKLKQIVTLIAKARREIEQLDMEDPTLSKTYFDRYMKAREQVGLDKVKMSNSENFMKYMVEDVALPEVDEEYRKLYGEEESEETTKVEEKKE